jgi:hypothetical protein
MVMKNGAGVEIEVGHSSSTDRKGTSDLGYPIEFLVGGKAPSITGIMLTGDAGNTG